MCTGFALKGKDCYLYARTIEFGRPLDAGFVLMPRNYQFKGEGPDGVEGSGLCWQGKYAVAAVNAFGLEIVGDGMNEKGLSGGLFYLPDSSVYQNPTGDDAKKSIASWQVPMWVLSNCGSVDEIKAALPQIFVNSSGLGLWHGVVKMHYIFHDMQGKTIAIEYLDGKLVMTDNPIGAFANEPPIGWHLANLRNYLNLHPEDVASVEMNGVTLTPQCSGTGMHGLPGDFTSASRFLRAVAFSQAAQKYASDGPAVETAWHLLNMFDIAPGAVKNATGLHGNTGCEATQISCVADPKNMAYYVRPYGSLSIQKFDLNAHDLDAKEMKSFKLATSFACQMIN